jgi:hypothetical protein
MRPSFCSSYHLQFLPRLVQTFSYLLNMPAQVCIFSLERQLSIFTISFTTVRYERPRQGENNVHRRQLLSCRRLSVKSLGLAADRPTSGGQDISSFLFTRARLRPFFKILGGHRLQVHSHKDGGSGYRNLQLDSGGKFGGRLIAMLE